MIKLIGLTGPKGGGKTTLCNAIRSAIPEEAVFVKASFADPLKMVCHILFGGERDNWWGDDAMKAQPCGNWGELLGEQYSSYRRIMQTVGTDIFRNHLHKNIWILLAQKHLDTLAQEAAEYDSLVYIIFDDVRFDNEAEFIRKNEGRVILTCKADYVSSGAGSNHSSEYGVSPNLVMASVHPRNLDDTVEYAKAIVAGRI